MIPVEKITRPERKFLPDSFPVTSWDVLKPYFDNLIERTLDSVASLRQWFRDRSELESVISEDLAWRYINMTCYTENEEFSKRYEDFVVNIQPKIAPVSDQLNKKAAASSFLNVLEKETGYDILIRNLKKDIEIFREKKYSVVYRDQHRATEICPAVRGNDG
jgi:oligoendopeptidase F